MSLFNLNRGTEMQFVDLTLARKLENAEAEAAVACAEALRRLRPKTPAAVERIGGGTAVFVGVQSPVTQTIGLGLEGPVTEADMKRLERFYFRRSDDVRVEFCPLAHASVTGHFGKRGYRVVEYSNMLTLSLAAKAARTVKPRGFTVELVGDQDVRLWTETVCQGFAEHFPVTPELLELMQMFGSAPGTSCHLARVDGKAAGGAALSLRGEVAGLFGASTLPEFRQRGIQTALVQIRLADARAAGCALAISIAQPGSVSHRNMERQGFNVAYTRVKFQKDRKASKG
jgi:GNAT superfamily N-acetyltransferase